MKKLYKKIIIEKKLNLIKYLIIKCCSIKKIDEIELILNKIKKLKIKMFNKNEKPNFNFLNIK